MTPTPFDDDEPAAEALRRLLAHGSLPTQAEVRLATDFAWRLLARRKDLRAAQAQRDALVAAWPAWHAEPASAVLYPQPDGTWWLGTMLGDLRWQTFAYGPYASREDAVMANIVDHRSRVMAEAAQESVRPWAEWWRLVAKQDLGLSPLLGGPGEWKEADPC